MVFSKEEAGSSSSTLLLPREDTPLLHKPERLSSLPKTCANVFIAIVGAGVLGLPYTFMRVGWVSGFLMITVVAYLTYHCMMLLVHTRRKLEEDKSLKIHSFGDLGFAVCGSAGRFAVDIMIVLSQAGFCVSYLIFIGNTMASFFPNLEILGFAAKPVFIWTVFPFQVGLNSIKTLTHLAPLSIFADVVDLSAMGAVMFEEVRIFLEHRPEVNAFNGGLGLTFYGLGVAVYAFEGIGMVLPLESETRDKKNFGKILGISMGFIALMYGVFGVLGYFAFGNATKDIITSNFGRSLLIVLIQLALALNLFVSFPLMMNPVHEVIERRVCGGRYCLWLRWLVVFATALVALMVPNFADFLSLVGSSVCCVLGFVLPALFHMNTFKHSLRRRDMVLDAGIISLGLIFGISGTISSIVEIFGVKV